VVGQKSSAIQGLRIMVVRSDEEHSKFSDKVL